MPFVITLIQTIWASLLTLGLIKIIIAIVIIAILARVHSLLGFLASILFIAYLAHWI